MTATEKKWCRVMDVFLVPPIRKPEEPCAILRHLLFLFFLCFCFPFYLPNPAIVNPQLSSLSRSIPDTRVHSSFIELRACIDLELFTTQGLRII